MRHLFKENLSLCFMRQFSGNLDYSHFLVTQHIVDNRTFFSSKGIIQQAPLYLYKQKKKKKHPFQSFMVFEPEVAYENKSRTPNISPGLYEKLNTVYNKTLSPEEILYYIYAVFYSTIYRTKYAEFLRIDFPRVPFTGDYGLFGKMAALGNQLANLHMLKIEVFDALISKYQGEGANSRVEKVNYNENEQRIYINPQKYFDNVSTDLWNYHIGGYQVLKKYLDDRAKAQHDIGDEKTFCRIITAIAKTIELQKSIDEIYPLVENNIIQ